MSKALRGSSVDKLAHPHPVPSHPAASHSLVAGCKSSPQIQRKIQNGNLKTSDKFNEQQPPATSGHTSGHTSGSTNNSQEQWIDGPRFHKSRMSRHHQLARTQRETWVDGPTTSTSPTAPSSGVNGSTATYGFMDHHKQGMIRQWVETQSAQVSPMTSSAHRSSNPFLLPTHLHMIFNVKRRHFKSTSIFFFNPNAAARVANFRPSMDRRTASPRGRTGNRKRPAAPR